MTLNAYARGGIVKLLALLYTIICTALHAQIPNNEGNIHFRTVGWKVEADDLYYESENKLVKIAVYDSSRSPNWPHPKTTTITFFRLVPNPEGKLVREEVAIVDVTAAGPKPLLVFMPIPESPKSYRVTAVADDLKVFPVPTSRFINLTLADLYIKFGEQELKLPAKNMALLDPHLKNADIPEARYTMMYVQTANGPLRVYSNNWAVRPTERTLVFIFAEGSALKVMSIVDDGT
jgi:hypothetical protein